MRFTSHRVQALLSACCALALRPACFTSRDLRHYLAPQLGKTAEDMTSGQISDDLRRLRAHQIIQRTPHSRSYQVTPEGLSIALFLTRVTQRFHIPGLAQLTGTGPPGHRCARQTAPTKPRSPASPSRHPSSPDHHSHDGRPAPSPRSHTRRNLTRNSESLRGTITQEEVRNLTGATAYDQAGQKVGQVATVYQDQATGEPEWLTVKTGLFGMKETFVPLALARVRGDREVELAADKDTSPRRRRSTRTGSCPGPKKSSCTATTGSATASPEARAAWPGPAARPGQMPMARRARRAMTPPGRPPMRR